MKTDYRFGDKVKVLKRSDNSDFEYIDSIQEGDTGFVLQTLKDCKYPVEVQFVGKTECFMFDELEFLKGNIEND